MKNPFKEVAMNRVKYSTFDLSHDRKFSCNMGELIPVMVSEILPGDRFKVITSQMIRMAPMLAPIMHRVDVSVHYFFVPNRIVWNGWERFISPDDPSDVPEFPLVKANTYDVGSNADYLGLPTDLVVEPVSAIPVAGLAKIWNEYYRDENLQDVIKDSCADGLANPDLDLIMEDEPLRRCWEHDYFTACLPFAQKGTPVTLPLEGTADVVFQYTDADKWYNNDTGNQVTNDVDLTAAGELTATHGVGGNDSVTADPVNASVDNSSNLSVDLSTASAVTINAFRNAIRLQEYLEKNARGGTRYIENIYSHFGVRSSDARLQRPEYLGGGKSIVMISELLQNSANDAEPTPLGTMAGHGLNVGETNQFGRKFEEHGYIFGIMSVMPKTAYYQGIPRHFSRRETLDFAFPSFAHIGEQEVLNKELYADHTDPDGTFGYIPRYSEYRFMNSSVHGDMRDSLLFWHLGRELPNDVALNSDFVTCKPSKRIFAAEGAVDTLWCHIYNQVYATRPLPKYGIPTL